VGARLFLSLLALLVTTQAPRAGELTPITGAIFHTAPYGYFDKSGNPAGFAFEIFGAIAKELNRPFQPRVVPFARMLEELKRGRVDIGWLYRSPISEQFAIPVSPIKWNLRNIILPRKGIDLASMHDLENLNIAWPRGAKFGAEFDQNETFNRLEVKDYETAMRLLRGGRTDAVVGSEPALMFIAQKLEMEKGKHLGEPFVINSKQAWIHMSKQTAAKENLEKWKSAVKRIHTSGALTDILNRLKLPK
jgi:polar amino acid transport system substrate-binding protein